MPRPQHLSPPRPISRRRATGMVTATALAAVAPGPLRASAQSVGLDAALLAATVDEAATLPRLQALVVARDGVEHTAQAFRGPGLDQTVNVKSVSKSVISALTGIAIHRGVLDGVDQPIAPLLGDIVPDGGDPRVATITVGHLLSMRSGLERTSGRNYGAWVNSANWARNALSRPFVDRPGGRMLYSTGNYHLLSALLTRAAERSTLALAREWLGQPLGIQIPPWTRDPQGIYLGGNNMALSPRALLRFGELYRRGGIFSERHVLPESWIEASWTPRVQSPFTGHSYGYGWFLARAGSHRVNYAWGFGGQMVYVVPTLGLTVVMTSDLSGPSGRSGYVAALHGLLARGVIPAAERAAAG